MITNTSQVVTIYIPLTITARQRRNCRQHRWSHGSLITTWPIGTIRSEWCMCGAVRYVPLP